MDLKWVGDLGERLMYYYLDVDIKEVNLRYI